MIAYVRGVLALKTPTRKPPVWQITEMNKAPQITETKKAPQIIEKHN
jgi:hypothetical protein